jgi:hypothetical protein
MEPEKLGRSLGIGVRVAGRMLRDRANQMSQPAPPPPQNPPQRNVSTEPPRQRQKTSRTESSVSGLHQATRKAAKVSGKAARGAKRFGEAIWGPLLHAGGLLWLEITGLFFALFALFFGQNMYRVRGAWRGGPEHAHLLLYAALTAVFIWFSVSSFLRAHRKSKRKR